MIVIEKGELDGELARLSAKIARYTDELGLAAADVVKRQSELLMVELAAQLPPKNRQTLEKKINSDIAQVFYPLPAQRFSDKKARGKELRWIYASKQALVGVDNEFYQPDITLDRMEKEYSQKAGKLNDRYGNKYTRLSRRGAQLVFRLNRIAVKKATFRSFMRRRGQTTGKLKASFCVGLKQLGRRLPQWIQRHIDSGQAKGTAIDETNQKQKPSYTIISRAKGASSMITAEKVRKAMMIRGRRINAEIKNWFKYRKHERTI